MPTPERTGITALTGKEKETLRLIVRGHDAKSIARDLDLSVHTINERLRGARRKLAVSSSREAARLLHHAERTAESAPEFVGYEEIGADADGLVADAGGAPMNGVGPARRWSRFHIGVTAMTLAFGLLALATLPPLSPAEAPPQQAASQPAHDPAIVDAARRFLVLVDEGNWQGSYDVTGIAFRELNTAEVWAATSEQVRVPMGAAISRTLVSQENLPAPPAGYEVVKFRTRFANSRDEKVETVTLSYEQGGWYVVGVTIG